MQYSSVTFLGRFFFFEKYTRDDCSEHYKKNNTMLSIAEHFSAHYSTIYKRDFIKSVSIACEKWKIFLHVKNVGGTHSEHVNIESTIT